MIPNNWWHVISGLLAAPVLWALATWGGPVFIEYTARANGHVKLVKEYSYLLIGIYSLLAVSVPVWLNLVNELRDEYHFWAWLPYQWGNRFDWWDIARCVPLAVVCCIVWWINV